MVTRKTPPAAKTTKATKTATPPPTRRGAAAKAGAAASKAPVAAKKKANGAASATATATATAPTTVKVKHKLVRDSFTIPKNEYVVLEDLKQRAMWLTRPTKKGELLRAGIVALSAMSDAMFLAALDKVPSLKTGRPKRAKVPASKAAAKQA